MNFIIEKYLSNFVEIDASQTKASIFSGIIKLKNLKIKNEIFETINLPYFEVVHGFIGNLTIKLTMPRFYKYPIHVEIEKLFIHVKQKSINKILKEDVIKAMEDYKKKLLLNEEELRKNWENVDNEEPGIFLQIINDLQIEIKEVVFHYEDTISYKRVPFTLGIILNKIIIKSSNKNEENKNLRARITEKLFYSDIKYKIFNIENLSIFLDCFDNINIFNSQILSKIVEKRFSSKNLLINKNDISDYLSYCMSELNIFSKNKNAHQYILYKMKLNITISINENYLKNKSPQYTATINLPSLNIRFNFKQIKTIFKVMAYFNLNNLYESGIAKEYYKKELNDKEKNDYVEKYIKYYQEKYYKKNENLSFPEELLQIENGLSFDDIHSLRETAYDKLDNINDYLRIKKELDSEENKWNKDLAKIEELNEELKKLEKKKIKIEKSLIKVKDLNLKDNFKERYEELNERISDINSSVVFSINEIKFIIYENTKKINDKTWEYKDILIKFIFSSLDFEGKIYQDSILVTMSLDNVIMYHEKTKNPNYQKVLFGDIDNRGKVLYMEFEKNPKLEKSDYKFTMTSEKRIHIIYDIHIFNYMNDKIMNVLNTKINFEEIKDYANEDSVNQYIQSGYVDYFLENFQHFNIDLNIDLTSPIILLPLDPFSLDNNKCILLRLGKLQINSDLPPRQEKDKDYKIIKNESLMYDIYKVKLLGTKLSTITDCVPVNNCVDYKKYETEIIRDFNLYVDCKKLIEIKNPHFDDLVCELDVSKVEMKLNEFQILFIIDYLGNLSKDSQTIFEENEINKFLKNDEAPKDEEQIIKDFQNRQSVRLHKNAKNENVGEIIQERSEEDINSSSLSDESGNDNNVEKEENILIKDNKTENNDNNKSEEEKNKDKESKKEEEEEKEKEKDKENSNSDEKDEKKKLEAFARINEIKNKKRTMRIQFVMNEMSLSVKKIHPDLKDENFLTLVQKAFNVDFYMMANNDMLTIMKMNNIYLYDEDIDEKKISYTTEQFQCLINSSQIIKDNKMCFIEMTSLYRKIDGITEIDTIFDMNDLNIIISFDSLLRNYQFMMYYYDRYNEVIYEIQHPQQKKGNGNFESFSMSSNKDIFIKRRSNKNLTQITSRSDKNKDKFKSNKISKIKKRKSGFHSHIKKEKINSKITIVYNMKNTIFKIPLNAKNPVTPIISFSFNLIYNQRMRNLYTNVLQLPQNLLIEKIYEIQDSTMNLLISKVYLDIEFKNIESIKSVYENEKLISNFRMSFYSNSYLYIPKKQSITISDINLEPLFCKFGVKQMGKLLEFYNDFNSFWFDFNNIKYIPLMKPEYINDGVVIIEQRKKRTFRECVLRIMIAIQIRKGYKMQLKYIKAKYKNKIKLKVENISDFNNHYDMNFKFDKIIMIFFDNFSDEKRLLLNVNISQMVMRSISNTVIKDKNNVSNIIYEMITGEDLPIEKYNKETLTNYMYINFSLEINYFNLIINEFEPLMEKIAINYASMQICPFSRNKSALNINDIINFNISSNAIKVVNLFLLRYYQKETEKKAKSKLGKVFLIRKKTDRKTTVKNDTNPIDKGREISLLLINYTELEIRIKFESKSQRYILGPKGRLSFSKTDLSSDKNQTSYCTKLKAKILNKAEINDINFGRNNTRQYKIKIEQNNKDYTLYLSIKVNTSGLIKQVHFCPSISICNDTNYKEIEIYIKDPKIKNNSLIIQQNEKCFVPLTWALTDPPTSNIYMNIKHNIEPVKIYEHINNIIVEPIDEEERKEKDKKKKEIEMESKNNKDKFWNQNEIKSLIRECDNRKDNRTILFFEENKRIYFSLDYYFVQSKEIKKILEEREKDMKSMNLEDTMTTHEEYSNDYHYDYLVYIRPYATFHNQLPFNLIYTHGNSIEKTIKTFNKSLLYNCLSDEKQQIRITFYYNGDKYRSPYFNISKITSISSIELLNYDKPDSPNLSCCILKSTRIVDFKENFNYDVKLVEFSTSSYQYTFFFKYLIMNKMSNSLWVKPYQRNKKIKAIETELKSGQLVVLNYNLGDNKYMIREGNSRWSKPFNLQRLLGSIELDTEIEKEEKNIINTIDVSSVLTFGKNYDNSRILIFQQQFIIHNMMHFDIYYRQENDKEKTNHFLKKETFESVYRAKEKKIFRLGLFDVNCGEFKYSSPFDIGILKAVDLLIKINELDKDKYDSHYIYTNVEGSYFVIVRIESHLFDDGLIYLRLTNPYFPSLKIENETETSIKIYESKNDDKPLIVDNNLPKGFPYVWKNTFEEKSTLILEIYGIQRNFSFSKYDKETFEIDFEDDSKETKSKGAESSKSYESSNKKTCKFITFSVYSKNKSLTRCLKIVETENIKQSIEPKKVEFNLFTKNNNKIKSKSFNVEIRGVGFSIINEAIIELFYISFYSIKFKYLSNLIISENNTLSENTENFELHLNNFQIDYCLHDSSKYIIAPRKQIIPTNDGYHRTNINELLLNENMRGLGENNNKKSEKEIIPFISFLVTKQFNQDLKTMSESTIYRQIDLTIQEFICKIDQYTLANLLNIINEFMKLLDFSQKLEKESMKEDIKLLNEKTSERIKNSIKNKNASKVLINYLFLSSLKINLTIRLNLSELYTSGFPKIITRVLGSIGNSLARFTDIPLVFTEKGFENIYISLYDILWIIIEEYKHKGTKQILKIIGSSDLIGNPVKLLEGIGTGFYELVNEPRKGFVQGPLQFGKGIAKGLGKFLSGIIGGTFGVVESITGTLYSATQSLMGREHENFVDEEEGPNNIASGAIQGLYGGFKELANGITGVVMHPINETKKNGVKGFFKGVGKGFIGLVISPFAALLKIANSFVTGTKNTINLVLGNHKIKIKRFRHPRVLLGGIEPLRPYEYDKADAKQALFKFMKTDANQIYSHYFYCANKGFEKGISLFIKTDKLICILYEARKIVFSERLKNIKKCEIHFVKGAYVVRFLRRKGSSIGFKVVKECFAMVCKIYDLLNKEPDRRLLPDKTSEEESDEEDQKDIIIEVNEGDNSQSKESKENGKINKYYKINTINNFYNINNINNIQNIYSNNYNENKRIFRNIKKTEDEETVVNDNSFYFSESIENLSGDFNEIRKKLKSRQKKYNDNNSFKSYSNVHNSKDKFFKFSESSNSQK